MNLARILANLTARIPSPRKAAPRSQQSFATLRAGQRLTNRSGFYVGLLGVKLDPGAEWTVTDVNDQGAVLTLASDYRVTTLVGKDWRDRFARLPARRRASPRASGLPSRATPAGES